jgi:hypothetical protein
MSGDNVISSMREDQVDEDTGRPMITPTTPTERRRHRRRHQNNQHVFWSSLCGMFEGGSSSSSSSSKTDSCSLAFCGIWLWERNRYLLTGETPKSWYDRPVEVLIMILLCITTIIWSIDPTNVFISLSFIIIAGAILWKLFEFQYERTVFRQQLAIEVYHRQRQCRNESFLDDADDGDGDGDDNGATTTTKRHQQQVLFDSSNSSEGNSNSNSTSNRNNNYRNNGNSSGSNLQDDPGLMSFLARHQIEIYGDGAHAVFGCANVSRNGLESHHYHPNNVNCGDDTEDDDDDNNDAYVDIIRNNNNDGDFCYCLWRYISNLCCGVLFSCYIQCFGICAIAQEHRHLKHHLLWTTTTSTIQPVVAESMSSDHRRHHHHQLQRGHQEQHFTNERWYVDYITFEPWSQYYPSIVRLRVSNTSRLIPHLRAISVLSTRLLKSVFIFLMVTSSVVVLLPVHFPKWQLLIVSFNLNDIQHQ